MRSRDACLTGLFVAIFCAAAIAAEGVPLRDASREDYPEADAVILLWEQDYRLSREGELRRRDRRVVKLFDARVNREFADPRVDFEEGREKVIIHQARTILPGGKILPVPEYSLNIAAPNDVAGWPEYASWRQRIVSFSGIRPGAVVELDYEVVTEPGVQPWLTADLRLAQRHPVLERRISVTVPGEMRVPHRLAGRFAGEFFESSREGLKTLRWHFHDLPAVPDEPQAHSWRITCGRLAFSLPGTDLDWVKDRLAGVKAAVVLDEDIVKLGKETVAGEPDPVEAARKVSALLKETFHLVRSRKARRSLACRPAPRVLASGYGNEFEAAALAAALLRGGGAGASPAVAVAEEAWDRVVPADAAFSGILLRIDWAGEPYWIDPLEGSVRNPGPGAPRVVLDVDREGNLRTERIARRGEGGDSLLAISGALTLSPTGKLTGSLIVNATGGFYDPASLGKPDQQKAWLTKVAGGLLSGIAVKSYEVHTLSDGRFKTRVAIEGAKPFLSHGKQHVLNFGFGPLFLESYPLPLVSSSRTGEVALRGTFRESVHIVVKLPDGWSATVPPRVESTGKWGYIRQWLSPNRSEVRLTRTVQLGTDRLSPEVFEGVRTVVNGLRTASASSVVVGPKD